MSPNIAGDHFFTMNSLQLICNWFLVVCVCMFVCLCGCGSEGFPLKIAHKDSGPNNCQLGNVPMSIVCYWFINVRLNKLVFVVMLIYNNELFKYIQNILDDEMLSVGKSDESTDFISTNNKWFPNCRLQIQVKNVQINTKFPSTI